MGMGPCKVGCEFQSLSEKTPNAQILSPTSYGHHCKPKLILTGPREQKGTSKTEGKKPMILGPHKLVRQQLPEVAV